MKKLLLTFLLALSFATSNAQLMNNKSKGLDPKFKTIKIQTYTPYQTTYISTGLAMVIGGAAMTTAGFLTQPEYNSTNTSPIPFFRQGPRMHSILGGMVFLSVGVSISIASR